MQGISDPHSQEIVTASFRIIASLIFNKVGLADPLSGHDRFLETWQSNSS
jgi:hypothetical protein